MHAQQIIWSDRSGWSAVGPKHGSVLLVLYFGTREALSSGTRYNELRSMFPAAHILGCSTGGQINNNDINDDGIVAAAIGFDTTTLQLVCHDITDSQQSRNCGE